MRRIVCVGVAVVFGLALTAGLAFAEKEVKVSLDKVPAKVKDAIQKEVKDGKIEVIEQKTKDGKTFYEVEYAKDAKKMEFCVTPEGTVTPGDDEKEVKVTLDQVPAKVKEAIQKQVQGGEIKEIEQKGEGEKATYEIEYLKDGKKAEFCLTAEGAAAKNEEDDDHKGK